MTHLPSRGWALLESRCNEYYQSIVKENFQRWRSGEFHIRRWAIKYGTLSDEEILNLNTHGIHNHLPALFSSIYYLRIPDELSSNDKGGTQFSSPWGAIMDLYMPRSRIMHAVEGLLIVFPSFIDHTPVPVDWISKCESRIVISTDLFFVSGEQLLKTDTSVIKVKPMEE
ncbi:MAG: hypothetical protein H6937_10355 [Burkholderiales bacterium]|nr:hypothetical protein [Burkholderiales bacterium]MCP5292659.1 hypothetical protein [Burkholderiales bacterium]